MRRASHGLRSYRELRDLFPEREDHAVARSVASVEVVFDRIPQRFVREADRWPAIFLAAAWIGDPTLLRVLASRPHVAVICTKDRLLGHGVFEDHTTPAGQRESLKQLRPIRDRETRVAGLPIFDADESLMLLDRATGGMVDRAPGVRCFGSANDVDVHHKFAVFCDVEITADGPSYLPRVAWTGSFNFTSGSRGRCENTILIDDARVADAYLTEWTRLLVMSEPVPWRSRAFAPEWALSRGADATLDDHGFDDAPEAQ